MHTGRGPGKVEAETAAMCLQGKNDQGLPAATRNQALLDFELTVSRAVRE